MRLIVATTNNDKLREIRGLLADAPVTLLSLQDFPAIAEPEETGETFADNARLKALYYDFRLKPEATHTVSGGSEPEAAHTVGGGSGPEATRAVGGDSGLEATYTVAEDSGLVVDALDGEPGVRSARFVRPDASYPERFAEIYRRLDERPGRPRTARFVCALAVVRGGDVVFETQGTVEGEIALQPSGTAGFGYDPIFYFPPYGCTLAEVSEPQKLRVAHRGVAFRTLAEWLLANPEPRT